jgi:integrase/recombinase XerD
MDNWKNKLINECKIRGYSRKTMNSYFFHIEKFIKSGLEPKKFILNMVDKGNSKSTVSVAGFAIKFYLKNVMCKEKKNLNFSKDFNVTDIPNIKQDKKLPIILSKKEIETMIISTNNLSHRLIIQVIYSAGLRASELRNLKWADIDFIRNTIHLKLAKGGKDRVVMLSPKIKKGLKGFSIDKGGLVFMSNRNKKYSTSTIEKIVSNAAKKAGIKKKVTPHTLRHCFATHLLEKGTDIRYIRDLLGHANLETTMIYTKVSTKDLSKIKSPLD